MSEEGTILILAIFNFYFVFFFLSNFLDENCEDQ